MSDNQKWEIIHGDALKVLIALPPHLRCRHHRSPVCFRRPDAIREKQVHRQKYSSMGENAPPPFDGDAKDQRSWTRWAAEWLYEARKASKPGAPVCMFIDWRQLPAATDALQWAGWIWRGTAVWDKATAALRKADSVSRRNTLSGAPTGICPSAVRYRVSPVCSNTVTRRIESISRKSPCSSCRTS